MASKKQPTNRTHSLDGDTSTDATRSAGTRAFLMQAMRRIREAPARTIWRWTDTLSGRLASMTARHPERMQKVSDRIYSATDPIAMHPGRASLLPPDNSVSSEGSYDRAGSVDEKARAEEIVKLGAIRLRRYRASLFARYLAPQPATPIDDFGVRDDGVPLSRVWLDVRLPDLGTTALWGTMSYQDRHCPDLSPSIHVVRGSADDNARQSREAQESATLTQTPRSDRDLRLWGPDGAIEAQGQLIVYESARYHVHAWTAEYLTELRASQQGHDVPLSLKVIKGRDDGHSSYPPVLTFFVSKRYWTRIEDRPIWVQDYVLVTSERAYGFVDIERKRPTMTLCHIISSFDIGIPGQHRNVGPLK